MLYCMVLVALIIFFFKQSCKHSIIHPSIYASIQACHAPLRSTLLLPPVRYELLFPLPAICHRSLQLFAETKQPCNQNLNASNSSYRPGFHLTFHKEYNFLKYLPATRFFQLLYAACRSVQTINSF